jgi:uncharacterized membrane protein YcaP (DUF421 family)
MEETVWEIIGRDKDDMEWWQFCIRAAIIFIFTIFYIKLGGKRMFGKQTTFDIVVTIILGSVLSRAISGTAPFFSTLLASVVIVVMHRILAYGAFLSSTFGNIVKGKTYILIKDGEILWDAMKKTQISEHDLLESLRQNAQLTDIKDVKCACLERSGYISIIPKEKEN